MRLTAWRVYTTGQGGDIRLARSNQYIFLRKSNMRNILSAAYVSIENEGSSDMKIWADTNPSSAPDTILKQGQSITVMVSQSVIVGGDNCSGKYVISWWCSPAGVTTI